MHEQYRTWCPDEGETEDDCRLFMAWDEEQAAKDHIAELYRDDPFENDVTVHVRCTRWDSAKRIFRVYPEPTIVFYAYEVTV